MLPQRRNILGKNVHMKNLRDLLAAAAFLAGVSVRRLKRSDTPVTTKSILLIHSRPVTFLVACMVASLLVGTARADLAGPVTYGFERITSNADIDIAGQLSVQVSTVTDPFGALVPGQVAFTFYNNVGVAGNLTEVYFDDGTLFGIASVVNSDGVDFDTKYKLSPGDLPGGDALTPDFVTSQGFGVDSASGSGNGVSSSTESVKIIFDLLAGYEFGDVIDAINLGLTNPSSLDSLRIGVHVRGIGDGADSDSFVLVPLPAGMLLGILGLSAAGLKLRKFV